MQPGDLSTALVAGLAANKRNRVVRELVAAGRALPAGVTVGAGVDGILLITAAEKVETGHAWHGHEVVQRELASGGIDALQVHTLICCQLRT